MELSKEPIQQPLEESPDTLETIKMDAINEDGKGIVNITYQSEPEDVVVIQNGDKKKKPLSFGKHAFQQVPALTVKKACKQYKKGNPILKDFNMTVEQGTM